MPRVSVIAKNYARALFAAAKKRNVLDSVKDELDAFRKIFNSDFVHELKNPIIPKLNLAKIMGEITKKIALSKLTSEFFLAVVRNRRINLFPEIYEEFLRLVKKSQNISEVEVISAAKLEKLQLDKIKNLVAKKYDDRAIVIKEVINKKILGGFQIKIGSEVIDSSLKNQLSRLSREFAGE